MPPKMPPKHVSSFGANKGLVVEGLSTKSKRSDIKSVPVKKATNASAPKPAKNAEKVLSRDEVEAKFDRMLEGDLTHLPHLPRSIVRIFLSSTFSDMRAERNMLARQVYPLLRKRCAEQQLDFQVVDLRWGLTSETENDHSGNKVCLQEVKNCQDVSLGPNFVSIIGHRYGMHRPLKVELPIEEMDILLAEAKALKLPDTDIVETWYQKDDNAVPPVYVLVPIRTHYSHYGDMSPGKEELRCKDLERWSDTRHRLQSVLQIAAKSACKAKKISEDCCRQHFMSVTDHEIVNGIVKASDPRAHTVCFTRDLTGLTDGYLEQKMAEKHFDVSSKNGKPCRDKDTQGMITELVKKVEATLGKDTVLQLATPWREGGIDPEKFPDHKEYISQFCYHFLDCVSSLIIQGINQRESNVRQREWYTRYNEVVHHLRFTNAKCESFCGQADALEKAKSYVLDPAMRKPLVIHAPSGAGKTSVMAMIMKSLGTWLPGGHVGIVKYLGTSPLTIHVNDVLYGLCGQLADVSDLLMEKINTQSYKRLKTYAPRLLRRISSILTSKMKKPAIILLDSLDQLASSDDAYSMDWLPTALPANVKIIVSTLPEEHGILDRLKQLMPDPEYYYGVPLLPESTGQEIIHKYMKLKKRSLTPAQLAVLLKAFNANPSPLYLILLMDEAVKYPSFFSPDPSSMPGSIRLAISALFDNLEAKFGRRLVQTALGLLSVGLDGLSDIEMEDALSCCDEALDEVYKFHDPPVPGIVRIPPVMWARIHYELRKYLVERLSQGKTTLFWYHRQFIETATERYTAGGGGGGRDGAKLHAVLFEMYGAEDGVRRSITLTNRKNLFVKDADRQTTPQPLTATNLRKLEAMTYHLRNAKDLVSVDKAKETVFTNFRFLSTKLAAMGADKVLGDLADYLRDNKDEELLYLKQFIETQRSPSSYNPRSFAFDIIARLDVPPPFSRIRDLQKQAEEFLRSSDKPQLIPGLPCLARRPGDPSLLLSGYARVLDQKGHCLLLEKESPDDEASEFAVVNVATGDVKDVVLEPDVFTVKMTAEGQGYAYLSGDSVKCKKGPAATKEACKTFKELFKGGKTVPKTTDGMRMSVSSDGSNVGLFLGAHTAVVGGDLAKPVLLSINKYSGCRVQCLVPCDADSVLIVASGDVSDSEGAGGFIATWKSGASSPSGTVEVGGAVAHALLAVTAEAQHVVCPVSSDDSHTLVIVQLQPLSVFSSVPCGPVSQLRVSSSQQIVALLSDGSDVQFIDASSGNKLERICHITAVSDFDVVWEDDRVVLADKDGEISLYARGDGKVLLKFTGHSPGVMYLRCIGESIAILTGSGSVKAWDSSTISSMMAITSITSPKSGGDDKDADVDSESLNYLTDVINILIRANGQELLTFAADGTVSAWSVSSLKKLRSFSIACTADVVTEVSSLGVVLDREKKILKVLGLDAGDAVCGDVVPDNVLAFTKTSEGGGGGSILTLSEQPQLTVHKILLEGKAGQVTKKINVQLGFSYETVIDIRLTELGRYLCLQVKISEKDYEKVAASWKKGVHLSSQRHRYRFAALDLNGSNGRASVCLRPLTQVPHLGVLMEPYTGNTMLICTRRWLIFWDIPTGKCDQRISKSARKTMFYRPDWVKAAAGANISLARSACSNLIACGSEDGYMFVYKWESGMPVWMKAPTSKHHAPVSHVCVTPDSSLVLSACCNGGLKMWSASTGNQVASFRLGSQLSNLQLTRDGAMVVAVTKGERSRVAIFKLHGKV